MRAFEKVLAREAWWSVEKGNCRELLGSLPDGSVDHVITDPPYEADCHTSGRRSTVGGKLVPAALTFPAMTEEERAHVGTEFGRLCRRWCLVFCQVEGLHKWIQVLEPTLKHARACAWVKMDGTPQYSGDKPAAAFEVIEVAHATGKRRVWNGGGKKGLFKTVFEHNIHDGLRPDHQTPKPVELMMDLIRLFTDPGDIILDPYSGSGTTGFAAVSLGRRFIGFEMNPKYVKMAQDRIVVAERGKAFAESARHKGGDDSVSKAR